MSKVKITISSSYSEEAIEAFAKFKGWNENNPATPTEYVTSVVKKLIADEISVVAMYQVELQKIAVKKQIEDAIEIDAEVVKE